MQNKFSMMKLLLTSSEDTLMTSLIAGKIEIVALTWNIKQIRISMTMQE